MENRSSCIEADAFRLQPIGEPTSGPHAELLMIRIISEESIQVNLTAHPLSIVRLAGGKQLSIDNPSRGSILQISLEEDVKTMAAVVRMR